MAFASITTVNATAHASATSYTVNLPASIAAGDLLLVLFALGGNGALTWPAGWTGAGQSLFDSAPSSNGRYAGRYRIADGSEGASITVTQGGVAKLAASQTLRITGWHGTTPPEVGTAATGKSTAADPPTLSPSWGAEDTLWIACTGLNSITAPSGFPTSYTGGTTQAATSVVETAYGQRNLNATSDNPAAFTNANVDWVAETIAIRPAAAAGSIIPILMRQYRERRS